MTTATLEQTKKKLPSDFALHSPHVFKDKKGKLRLGRIEKYGDKAEQAYAQGKYIIVDSVFGFEHILPIDECKIVGGPSVKIEGASSHLPADIIISEAWATHWHDEAEKIDDALKEFGVGAMFSIGVADGAAYYVVTHVKGTRCYVEWRGFGCDDYFDHHFGGGGSFPKKEVMRYCRKYPKTHIFAKRRSPWALDWKKLEELGIVPKGMID